MSDSKSYPRAHVEFLKEAFAQANEIDRWYESLKSAPMASLISSPEDARHTAIFCADMINDFCKPGGALYSDRIEALIVPVGRLFYSAYEAGVATFVLIQDYHSPNAKEFEAFPSHAVINTNGAKTISELLGLPFADRFITFCKNTISPAFARRQILVAQKIPSFRESFEDFLHKNDIRTALVAGDCTDLCARELPMYLKFWANQRDREMRVVIPEDCVATFHLPPDVAHSIGVQPHPGDFYHRLALYEMARHKIDVLKEIL